MLDEIKATPLPTSAVPRYKLPTQLSSFVGRQREIDEVRSLLKTVRLVTLTGPGGTGMTGLNLQIATRNDDYADGVAFVGLASTRGVALVASAIAQKFGVKEQPNHPVAKSLGRHLSRKQMLLVLDNFEHVLDAAPLVSDLLATAPRLTILVTSREVYASMANRALSCLRRFTNMPMSG